MPVARRAAEAAGVTRLADVTRLDRLGLPVWQAVRPLSRALSVHQGKGATHDDAKIGALLEAVESDAAERFDADGPVCAYDDLPPAGRPPTLLDFAVGKGEGLAPDARLRWVEAGHPLTGRRLHVPFDAVSLDFTRGLPSPLDRCSNGVATAATRPEAVAVALHELIERDAVTELRAGGLLACTRATLRLDSVPFAWLAAWRARFAAEKIAIRLHHAPSVTGTPVFICELNDHGKDGAPYRALYGHAAHPSPELALFKALAEAVQVRATCIAGARDDLEPRTYRRRGSRAAVAIGLPPPPGMAGVEWRDVPPGPMGLDAIVETLARAGYSDVATVDLARIEGLHVVRAFACGLGSFTRRRRPAP